MVPASIRIGDRTVAGAAAPQRVTCWTICAPTNGRFASYRDGQEILGLPAVFPCRAPTHAASRPSCCS